MEHLKLIASSQLKDHIIIFDSILDNDSCNQIVSEYNNSPNWIDGESHTYDMENDDGQKIRKCKKIAISNPDNWEDRQTVRKKLDDLVFNTVGKIISYVIDKYPTLALTGDTGYDLTKYETGSFFKIHTDGSTKQYRFRQFSCSIVLNDDFEGGEFQFFEKELTYSLKKGSAIVFPSNFMFPHEVAEVTNGTRYSIITWFT